MVRQAMDTAKQLKVLLLITCFTFRMPMICMEIKKHKPKPSQYLDNAEPNTQLIEQPKQPIVSLQECCIDSIIKNLSPNDIDDLITLNEIHQKQILQNIELNFNTVELLFLWLTKLYSEYHRQLFYNSILEKLITFLICSRATPSRKLSSLFLIDSPIWNKVRQKLGNNTPYMYRLANPGYLSIDGTSNTILCPATEAIMWISFHPHYQQFFLNLFDSQQGDHQLINWRKKSKQISYNSSTNLLLKNEGDKIFLGDIKTKMFKYIKTAIHPKAPVIFSSNINLILYAIKNNTIASQLLDPQLILAFCKGHKDTVTALCSHPKELIFFSGDKAGIIFCWDPVRGIELNKYAGHRKDITCLALHPNNEILASGSKDHSIIVWHIEDAVPIYQLVGHMNEIHSIAIHQDGRRLFSGSSDKTIRIWNLETASCSTTLHTYGSVRSLILHPNGKQFITRSKKQLIVWTDLNDYIQDDITSYLLSLAFDIVKNRSMVSKSQAIDVLQQHKKNIEDLLQGAQHNKINNLVNDLKYALGTEQQFFIPADT